MITQLVACLWLVACISANTETHVLKVPFFFDVPPHSSNYSAVDSTMHQINETHSIIYDYPIVDRLTYQNPLGSIEISELKDGESQNILIRLNNYYNSTYESDDLMFIKLCWPATYPIDFGILHTFMHTNQFDPTLNLFDLYLVVTYTPNFKTYNHAYDIIPQAQFKLIIQKLPNRLIPIPLEVYDIIVYLVDIAILLRLIAPKLYFLH